jgi:hypothetical protein
MRLGLLRRVKFYRAFGGPCDPVPQAAYFFPAGAGSG